MPTTHPLTLQMDRGRGALAQLLTYWLRTSGLAARNLELLTDWAVGERGWLGNDKITRIRQAEQQRGAGLRQLVAMGEVNQALLFEDFACVMTGQLQLPYLAGAALPPAPPDRLSVALSDLLNEAMTQRGLNARDGLRELMAAYPAKERGRRSQLQDLILGATSWDRDQIEAELCAVAEALRLMRGLPVGAYGPGHLAQELSAALPPSA